MTQMIKRHIAHVVGSLLMAIPLLVSSGQVANAASYATIGSVSITSRSGTDFGRDAFPPIPVLNFCVTWTTTDQYMMFEYEVTDDSGSRPPFGNAYQSGSEWMSNVNWEAGYKVPPVTWCSDTGLEYGKTYTINTWVMSGPFDTRGGWGSRGVRSGGVKASYTYTTGSAPTTTTTTTTTTIPATTTTISPRSGGRSTTTTVDVDDESTQPTSPIRSRTSTTVVGRTTTTTIGDLDENDGEVEEDYADLAVRRDGDRFQVRVFSSFDSTEMLVRARCEGRPTVVWRVTTSRAGTVRFMTTRPLVGCRLSLWLDEEQMDSLRVR